MSSNDTPAPAVPTRSRRIPIEDFFRNPQTGVYRISPDGTKLAFLRPYESRMNIFVRELTSDQEIRLTSQTDRDISTLYWKGNETILYSRDFGGDENFHVLSVYLSGQEGRDLTPFPGVRARLVDDLEEQSETDILVGLNNRDPRAFDVHRLNTVTGAMELVAQNPGNIDGWMADHDGRLRIAIATDGVETTVLYREKEDEEFRPVLTTDFRESLDPIAFTSDNRSLYALSNLKRDRTAVVVFDMSTGKEIEVVYEHPEVDVDNASYSPLKKRLRMASYITWKLELHALDPEWGALLDRLRGLLPEMDIIVSDLDRNEEHALLRTTVTDRLAPTISTIVPRTGLRSLAIPAHG